MTPMPVQNEFDVVEELPERLETQEEHDAEQAAPEDDHAALDLARGRREHARGHGTDCAARECRACLVHLLVSGELRRRALRARGLRRDAARRRRQC